MKALQICKGFLATALLFFATAALAQSVQQSGGVTRNHLAIWNTSGVIQDGGSAADSPLSSLGVTNSGGAGICVSSDRQTAAGRNQLCFGASTTGAATISLQNYGTAVAQNLCFVINGTQVCIPTAGGGTIPTITTPTVNNDYICANGIAGNLKDCGWTQTAGTANQIPFWSSATVMGNIAAANNGTLITSAGGVPSISSTLPSAVQLNITQLGTISAGAWNGTAVTVPFGGTGATSLAAGVLIGNGTSAISSVTTASVGLCILSQGASPPVWGGCASGAGSAAGANNQVQYNNASSLAGSPNLIWISPQLTIGQNAAATGQLGLANGGGGGATITVQNTAASSAYNFNLPATAGTSGQPMLSGGGVNSAMTFGTLGAAGGGTNCSVASGTCLDNITGFASTGFINRSGAGTYSFSPQIGLANGGTGANLTASNGGLVYSTASALAILSGTATANQIPLSGSNAAPAWSTATYPATTTANQLLYSSATNTIGGLATGNNGVLITSAGGVPSISSTIPNATQLNITALGTIATGVWNGSNIPLANGGTNANLTASNGGVFYSTASAGAILAGTATASLPLLSGSTAAPTWATVSYPTSATSGGIPYFSSTTAMASSALLTANQIMIGGGAGTAPTTFACATTTTLVHGGTPPTCGQLVNGDITANTITNASLATAGAATFKGNATAGTASVTDFTLQGLTDITTPNTTLDFLPIYNHTTGTIQKTTAAEIAAAIGGGVTSLTPGAGLVSSVSAACSQTAITATGTLSKAECTNAQTGTSYAIVDGDRAKLVTASNAAAQAYTIAQAGNAGAFQTGWYTDVRNISTNVAGIVTITPTTSTINGASTLKIQPGQSARIVSDGTNYLVAFLANAAQVPGTTTNDNANAGNVGEYVSSEVLLGTNVSMTNNTPVNITSVSLIAGDWQCSGNALTNISASVNNWFAWISTVSATLPTLPNKGSFMQIGGGLNNTSNLAVSLAPLRLSLSTTTTVFMTGEASFTAGAVGGYGFMDCTRIR